jgi:hypothetical protein
MMLDVTFIMEIGSMERRMAMENIATQMGLLTKDIGLLTDNTEMELKHGQMDPIIKGHT